MMFFIVRPFQKTSEQFFRNILSQTYPFQLFSDMINMAEYEKRQERTPLATLEEQFISIESYRNVIF